MKPILGLVNIVLALSLFVWPIGLFLSLFTGDSPDSTSSVFVHLFLLTIWTYPIPIIAGQIRFWKKEADGDVILLKGTFIGLSYPILWVIMLSVNSLFCKGKIACF
jgi:hypothetical protein